MTTKDSLAGDPGPQDRQDLSEKRSEPATPPPAVTAPATGATGGVPVGIVGATSGATDAGAHPQDPDPAEAEFERLTGHKTDESAGAERR